MGKPPSSIDGAQPAFSFQRSNSSWVGLCGGDESGLESMDIDCWAMGGWLQRVSRHLDRDPGWPRGERVGVHDFFPNAKFSSESHYNCVII
jgi:hypothetical protein